MTIIRKITFILFPLPLFVCLSSCFLLELPIFIITLVDLSDDEKIEDSLMAHDEEEIIEDLSDDENMNDSLIADNEGGMITDDEAELIADKEDLTDDEKMKDRLMANDEEGMITDDEAELTAEKEDLTDDGDMKDDQVKILNEDAKDLEEKQEEGMQAKEKEMDTEDAPKFIGNHIMVGRFSCFSVFNLYFRLEKLWTTIFNPLQGKKKNQPWNFFARLF